MHAQDLNLRPARRDECRCIAELFRISSDGVADYIWSKLARPGEDLLEVGRRRYERQGVSFSYENCTMAELQGIVVGMLVAFPMKTDGSLVETDPVLLPYNVLEEDLSYYIAGMAVDVEHRGKGIGSALLAQAEASCRQHGLKKLSLIVFEQNGRARDLYRRTGYAELRRHPVVPHRLIHYTGDALLMVKQLG